MSIWILAIVIIGLCAVIGFYSGAIRQAVVLAGLVLAAVFCRPLGPAAKSLLSLVGVKDPICLWAFPSLVSFAVIVLIAWVAAFLVHRQVALYYKYRTDDLARSSWERLNQRLGLGLGVVSGAIYLVAVALPIYVAGYLTVQVASDNPPAGIRVLNQLRTDMKSSGLDKIEAAFDATSAKYYDAADLLGLIYHNRLVEARLANYPPFLLLDERQQFQDMASDTDFLQTLNTEQNFKTLLYNPHIQAIIQSPDLMQTLLSVDLKDLRHYLETGQSPKYASERILGRWGLDADAVLLQMRKLSVNLTTSQFRGLRAYLNTFLSGMTLVATPDNKVVLKGRVDLSQIGRPVALPATSFSRPPSAGPRPQARGMGMAIDMARRLDRYRQPPPQNPTPVPTQAKPAAPPPIKVLANGTWEKGDDGYQVTFQDANGGQQVVQVKADADRLILLQPANPVVQTLVFYRRQ